MPAMVLFSTQLLGLPVTDSWESSEHLLQSFLYHAGLMPPVSCFERHMRHEISYFW